ncbi:hypothetical protein [Dokdonia sp.]
MLFVDIGISFYTLSRKHIKHHQSSRRLDILNIKLFYLLGTFYGFVIL